MTSNLFRYFFIFAIFVQNICWSMDLAQDFFGNDVGYGQIPTEGLTSGNIPLKRNYIKLNEEGTLVNKIEVLNTKNGIFLSIYHRGGSTQSTQQKAHYAMNAVKAALQNKPGLGVFQFQLDHGNDSRDELLAFHETGEAGVYENHYHLRTKTPISAEEWDNLLRYLRELQNGDYISQEMCDKLNNHYFPSNNLNSDKKENPKILQNYATEGDPFDLFL